MIQRHLVVALLTMILPLTGLASAGTDPCANQVPAPATAAGGVHQAGPMYVDIRSPTSVWIYEESNGIDGLQRGGYSILPGGDRDTCVDNRDIKADSLIY